MRSNVREPLPRKSPVILVVDDDEDIVRMLRTLLESHSYSCLTAHGGAQALSQFASHGDIDVIVTDLNMTSGDGLSFIQTVRRNSHVPIFVISGRIQDYAKQMIVMDDVVILPKPIESRDFIKRIRSCCRHRKHFDRATRVESSYRSH